MCVLFTVTKYSNKQQQTNKNNVSNMCLIHCYKVQSKNKKQKNKKTSIMCVLVTVTKYSNRQRQQTKTTSTMCV